MAQGCQNLVPLQVGRHLGCTGRGANAVRKAARDPKRGSRRAGQPVHVGWQRTPFLQRRHWRRQCRRSGALVVTEARGQLDCSQTFLIS